MSEVTEILGAVEQGDPNASEQLLSLLYDELRALAAGKLSREPPGYTLQATALVHEVFIRIVGSQSKTTMRWNSRGHFFAAAAEAMRRILVDSARRRKSLKRGGGAKPAQLDEATLSAPADDEDLLAVHDVLDELSIRDAQAAQLVKLRFFAGLTMSEAAQSLGVSLRSAHDIWSYARAWLRDRLQSP